MSNVYVFDAEGRSENGVGDADGGAMMNDDTVDAAAAAAAAPTRRLFTLQIVNSYGSTEVERLVDDGKPCSIDGE